MLKLLQTAPAGRGHCKGWRKLLPSLTLHRLIISNCVYSLMVSDPVSDVSPLGAIYVGCVGTPLSLFKDRASAPKTRSRCQLVLDVLC